MNNSATGYYVSFKNNTTHNFALQETLSIKHLIKQFNIVTTNIQINRLPTVPE